MTKQRRARDARRPRATEGRVAPKSNRWLVPLLAIVLAATTWVAYSSSFNGVFVFDDRYAILDNPHIKSLWPLTEAMSAPPENPVSARPVASLTLALNYALADPEVRDAMQPGRQGDPPEVTERFLRNVWGYHLVNLLLHVAAGLALFGVVRRTLRSARLEPRIGAASTPLAFAVALVWLVHPLTVDAVTYVCQRTEVLMGLFCLLTLYCAIRAIDLGRARPAWIAAAIAACALGMGSKQTMAVVPVMVWLWERTFTEKTSGADASASRLPLYAGLAATWAVLAALVVHERWPHSIGLDRNGWTPWRYLLTQTGVIAHYLRLVFAPAPLVLDYDGWPAAHGIGEVWPYAIALVLAGGVTIYGVVRRQPWSFPVASVFLLLAPSSSLLPLPTEIAAERRMYVPLAAIVALAVTSAYAGAARVLNARSDPRRARSLAAAGGLVVVVIVVSLIVVTQARNRDFWSDTGIWADTVSKRPDNPRARLSYGVALIRERRVADAEAQLREAVRLADASAPAHGGLGALLCMTGRTDEGIAQLERALALDPEYTDAFRNLGEAYASQGRRAQAATYFARAVAAAPDNPFLLSRLGWLLATSPEASVRDGAKAVAVSEKAVRLTSRRDVMALDTLAAAYAEAGRFADAASAAREAAALAAQQGDARAAGEISVRLAQYLSGRPYREPATS